MFEADVPADVAYRLKQVQLAQEFGWTLEYIDALDEFTVAEIFGILDGLGRYRKWKQSN